jgi:hypothetical protein
MTHQHFYIMTAKPKAGDAGQIDEGWYVVKDDKVILTDCYGVPIGVEREIEERGALFTGRCYAPD